MRKQYKIDMVNGPLFSKIIIFSIPLILSGVLQLLFNAADIVVVGKFTGSHALAAVGSTSSLINLLVNLFIGISVGANVVIGRYIGANDHHKVSDSVHCAMWVAIYGGILMIFVGNVLARPLLEMMQTPSDVIDLSVLYMRIYFAGMPFFMVYNFGAAILRSIGDTKRPLYFLFIAGIINVIFNLFFVIVLQMGVAGVALATIISQAISAILITLSLMRSDDYLKLDFHSIRYEASSFKQMMQVGLPAGLQGVIFNISNVLIQSSVNSFGPLVMAGNTAASNIEGFVYTSMNSIYQTALSFTSQNMGAKKYERINKILLNCLIIVTLVGLILGNGAYLFGNQLLALYTNDSNVIAYGLNRLAIVSVYYFLCGIMDVFVGVIRGMGYSIMPMIVSLSGACLFRIIWIFTIFAAYHTQFMLYISYPISWIITSLIHFVCFIYVYRKLKHSLRSEGC